MNRFSSVALMSAFALATSLSTAQAADLPSNQALTQLAQSIKANGCTPVRPSGKVYSGKSSDPALGVVKVAVMGAEGCGGGNNWHTEVMAFSNAGKSNSVSVTSATGVKIQGTDVIVEDLQLGPNDPMCCPTQKTVQKFSLNGTTLKAKR